ncbi:MAG TPA: hypothetical protein PLV92_22455, partial [Pirellulaceae bacterium]|nr:hypothetical protein [Pirellulaceae bacterium]
MTILSSLSFSSSFRRAATVVALVLFRWVGAADVAQAEDILRGTLVKLDVPGREIVVKRDGRDETYGLDDETRVLSATGRDLAERLKDFRAGDAIFFKPTTRGGRKVLDGIRLVELKGDAKEQGKPGEKPRGDGADRGGAADRRNDGGGRPTPAVVKSIDGERLRIVLKVGERELDLHVTPRTQFRGSRAETQGESLREFKAGDEVFFLAGKDDGRDVLIGLSAMNGGPRPEGANRPDGANRPGGEGNSTCMSRRAR